MHQSSRLNTNTQPVGFRTLILKRAAKQLAEVDLSVNLLALTRNDLPV